MNFSANGSEIVLAAIAFVRIRCSDTGCAFQCKTLYTFPQEAVPKAPCF